MTERRASPAERLRERLVAMRDGSDGLAEEITRQIREALPEYEKVPWEDHYALLATDAANLLQALADEAEPAESDVALARRLGVRRARQGMALADVVSAYHISFRNFWERVLERAGDDPAVLALLSQRVLVLWRWIDTLSTVMATAHTEESVRLRDSQSARLLALLDAVEAGTPDSHAVLSTRRLGLDPEGRFVAVCVPLDRWGDARSPGGLLGRGVTVRSTARGGTMTFLVQGAEPAAVAAALRGWRPDLPAGVSAEHQGLARVALCLEEALRVLAVAQIRGEPVGYDEYWLLAILLEERHHLTGLLGSGVRVAQDNPHLAEAVRAFADGGMSVTECGRRLHMHANTVRYRLDRWTELTGWDPRTFPGPDPVGDRRGDVRLRHAGETPGPAGETDFVECTDPGRATLAGRTWRAGVPGADGG